MLEKITPYFIGVIILCIIAEAWYSIRNKKDLYDKQDSITSIVLGLLGVLTRIGLKGINLAIWFAIYRFSPFKIETSAFSLVMLFLLNEFVYYWFHRWSHEVPLLWATHVNHHSSMKMNFSVAARTPFLNAIYHILFWLPLPFLGFHPIDILLIETLSFFFAFVQHTTIIPKLGVIEWVFNTPSHHRVHHASNEQYLNKNYGNVLIIYDRLFGTFTVEDEEPVYGLTHNPENRGLLNMIFHGWKELIANRK
ncbi:MAG: sterol desaturase family protein [Bacteroidota bacterium]